MAKAVAKKEQPEISIEIAALEVKVITMRLVGTTPLILNRQSEKTKRQLLLPPRQKNKAERAQTLKHEPYEEFRASPYLNRDPATPTLLHLPGGFFKRSTASAALDIPGASKAQVGRLVSLASTQINVWGIPHMRADMVRQAGPSRTPDVRFRACLPEWATEVAFTYIPSIISPQSLVNLVGAAGIIIGVGDYRVEKGAGDYGKFRIAPANDEEWARIVAEGGRDAQQHAMDHPIFFDQETEDLVTWFDQEIENRRKTPDIAISTKKKTQEEVTTQ